MLVDSKIDINQVYGNFLCLFGSIYYARLVLLLRGQHPFLFGHQAWVVPKFGGQSSTDLASVVNARWNLLSSVIVSRFIINPRAILHRGF